MKWHPFPKNEHMCYRQSLSLSLSLSLPFSRSYTYKYSAFRMDPVPMLMFCVIYEFWDIITYPGRRPATRHIYIYIYIYILAMFPIFTVGPKRAKPSCNIKSFLSLSQHGCGYAYIYSGFTCRRKQIPMSQRQIARQLGGGNWIGFISSENVIIFEMGSNCINIWTHWWQNLSKSEHNGSIDGDCLIF